MSSWTELVMRVHRMLILCYPAEFRAEFGNEMQSVLTDALIAAKMDRGVHASILFARELRDLPGSVWREHLRTRRGNTMKPIEPIPNKQLTPRETLAALAIFVLPAFTLAMGRLPEWFHYFLVFTLLAIIAVPLVLGIIKGFPRWTVPYLGIVLTTIVMLEPSWRLWEKIYPHVYKALGGKPSTLPTRVTYQALMSGFFWFMAFTAAVLLILLLMTWPRTRQLARRIRGDWTLLSFLLYGGVAFAIVLVFEEYRYHEPWMIASLACLTAGAWIHLKSETGRKRILALLGGVTLAYWIAAIGKWYLVPLQTWGAFHGYQYVTYSWFAFWRTLAEWGWVILIMLIPALLTLIPRPQKSDSAPEENLAPA